MTVHLQLGTAQIELEASRGRIFVGRARDVCQLVHDDPSLSRRHAEIWIENGQPLIRDLGTATGTWIDGEPVDEQAVPWHPGQHVWIGHVPLFATWGAGGPTIRVPEVSAERRARISQRQQHQEQIGIAAAAAIDPSRRPHLTVPDGFAIRNRGSKENGTLLLALRHDTFSGGSVVEGYVELSSARVQTVVELVVELVEIDARLFAAGRMRDRFLIEAPRQMQRGEVMPRPFQLRVAIDATSSTPGTRWEIRSRVGIYGFAGIDAMLPITIGPDH